MRFLADFHTAIRAAIGNIWDDCLPNGIEHELVIARWILEDKVEPGQLPLATFRINYRQGIEWGSTSLVYGGEILIHRLEIEANDTDALVGAVEDLRDYLYPTSPLAVGQVIGYPVPSYDPDVPLLRFLLTTQRPYTGAALLVPFTVGTTSQ